MGSQASPPPHQAHDLVGMRSTPSTGNYRQVLPSPFPDITHPCQWDICPGKPSHSLYDEGHVDLLLPSLQDACPSGNDRVLLGPEAGELFRGGGEETIFLSSTLPLPHFSCSGSRKRGSPCYSAALGNCLSQPPGWASPE